MVTRIRWGAGAVFLLAAASLCTAGAQIQIDGLQQGQGGARQQAVELETGSVKVKPGSPEWVELRFQVRPGMHINSHAPHDELLVPTSLITGGSVKVLGSEYPAGIPLRLDVGAGEVLSTYQGEFAVRLQVVVPQGVTELQGALRYQACDARSCFPPKTLPVRVALTAR